MRPKLSAMTTEQRAQLLYDAAHAPGPELPKCVACGDSLSGSYGVDFKAYCRDCVDWDEWLAGKHAAEAAHV